MRIRNLILLFLVLILCASCAHAANFDLWWPWIHRNINDNNSTASNAWAWIQINSNDIFQAIDDSTYATNFIATNPPRVLAEGSMSAISNDGVENAYFKLYGTAATLMSFTAPHALSNPFEAIGIGTGHSIDSTSYSGPVAIGAFSQVSGFSGTALGFGARAEGNQGTGLGTSAWAGTNAVAIGAFARARNNKSIAIGLESKIDSGSVGPTTNAMQFGKGNNTTANTVQFWNHLLLDTAGYVWSFNTPTNDDHVANHLFVTNYVHFYDTSTVRIAAMHMTNLTVVTIAAQDTPVVIGGTAWVASDAIRDFTVSTAGRMTYTGPEPVYVQVVGTVSLEPASGQNKDLAVYIATNGVVMIDPMNSSVIDSGDPGSVTTSEILRLIPNDYIELWVENRSGAQNLDAIRSHLTAQR